MTATVEQLTDRGAIRDGISLWNDQHPGLRISDRLVANVFAPFSGLDVRCYGGYAGEELVAFGVLKRLTRSIGGYDPTDTAWLSLFAFDADRGRPIADELLTTIGETAVEGGAARLRFGGDPQNFVAGVPNTVNPAYRDVLTAAGFAIDTDDVVYDLQRNITEFAPPDAVRATGREWPGLGVERATDHEPALQSFLADQFPGRWHYEAGNICRVPGGPEDYWVLLYEDSVIGFARSNRHDGAYRGANANWGWRLADEHCGIGPLGVHADYRGRGWGLYMICEIVCRLRYAGYESAVIDWTDLPGYYEQLGFERWIAYDAAVRDLSSVSTV